MAEYDPLSEPLPYRMGGAQCHATSKQTGQRCRRPAIAGATVCRHHGAGAPQVKAAARQRLLAAVDPVSAALVQIALDESRDDRARLVAIRDILDRVGLREAEVVQVVTIDVVEAEIARLEAELAGEGID